MIETYLILVGLLKLLKLPVYKKLEGYTLKIQTYINK